MSLDIYITSDAETVEECICDCCDNKHERRYFKEIEHFNITHNLANMASKAGIYDCLWRPNENGIETCEQMIDPLENGLNELIENYKKYLPFNPENGWGSHQDLVSTVEACLNVCKKNPKARIRMWR